MFWANLESALLGGSPLLVKLDGPIGMESHGLRRAGLTPEADVRNGSNGRIFAVPSA
jgi:hypothetical protein